MPDPQAIRHLGLDIGTTNTSLCYTSYSPGERQFDVPTATRFDDGDFLRSTLLLGDAGQPIAFGDEAFRHPAYLRHPERLRQEFKLQLGDDPDAEHLVAHLAAEAARRAGAHLQLDSFDEDTNQTTVGVPAHWVLHEYQRVEAMLRAVSAAGLPNVKATPEPVAAMLLHTRLGQIVFKDNAQFWLVIDIGGGTTDLAIVETQPGGALPVVRYTYGRLYGGRDFDRILLERLLLGGRDVNALSPSEHLEFLTAARAFKESFSRRMALDHDEYVERVYIGGRPQEVRLSRAAFEAAEMAGPLIAGFDRLLREAFLRAGRSHAAIDGVILTGGSARWYFVRRTANRFFGRDVCLISNEPELTIAQGLALTRTGFSAPTGKNLNRILATAPPPPPDPEAIELTSVADHQLDLVTCRARAWRVVQEKAVMAGGVALVLSPIPGISQVPLTSIEAKMVYDVALIYGYKLEERQLVAVVTSLLAGGTVAKIAVMEAATFFPVVGSIVKTAVGGGAALGFGKVAIDFFEKRRRSESGEAPQ